MYQAAGIKALLRLRPRQGGVKPAAVGSTAILLGITSMLTDISSEMVAAILPLYLVFNLGMTPLQYGAIDGIYQGASSFARIAGGYASDKWRRHKDVASAGYGLSAACRLGIIAAGASAGAIALVVFVDRIGKGIRTGPRDALITLTSTPARLGYAFGVHRALDTFGAMLGPLIAFGLLALAPGSYDTVFVVSFCFAIVGLSVIVLFVKNVAGQIRENRPSIAQAIGLLREQGFRRLNIVAAFLGLTTISDAFIYLTLQDRFQFNATFLPLLFVATAAAFALLAIPMGRLADRFGRMRVFFAGYALLPIVYTSLLLDFDSVGLLIAYLVIFGAFYAATEGVLMAHAGTMLPSELTASGLSILTTTVAVSKLLASVAFGAVWTLWGLQSAIVGFCIAVAIAVVVSAILVRKTGATHVQA
jgi:MFS family permease